MKGTFLDIKELYSSDHPRRISGSCMHVEEIVKLKDPNLSPDMKYKLKSTDHCEKSLDYIAEF